MIPVWRSVGQGTRFSRASIVSVSHLAPPTSAAGPWRWPDGIVGLRQGDHPIDRPRRWHRWWAVQPSGAPVRGGAAVRSLSAPVRDSNSPDSASAPCGFPVQLLEHSPGAASAKLICPYLGTACQLRLGRSDAPTLRSACGRHGLALPGVLPGEGHRQRAFAARAAPHVKRPRTMEGPAISPPPPLPARAPETGMRFRRGRRARLHAR